MRYLNLSCREFLHDIVKIVIAWRQANKQEMSCIYNHNREIPQPYLEAAVTGLTPISNCVTKSGEETSEDSNFESVTPMVKSPKSSTTFQTAMLIPVLLD